MITAREKISSVSILTKQHYDIRKQLQQLMRSLHYAYAKKLDSEKEKPVVNEGSNTGKDIVNAYKLNIDVFIYDVNNAKKLSKDKLLQSSLEVEYGTERLSIIEKFLNNQEALAKVNSTQLFKIQNALEEAMYALTAIPVSKNIDNDDELRNINSYEYLYELARFIPNSLRVNPTFNAVWCLYNQIKSYDLCFPYGDLYTKFQLQLQQYIREKQRELKKLDQLMEKIWQQSLSDYTVELDQATLGERKKRCQDELEALDNLVIAIFANNNAALQRSWAVIKPALSGTRQTRTHHAKKTAGSYVKGSKEGINKTRPTKAETLISQAKTNYFYHMLSSAETGQPMKIALSHQDKHDPEHLRFGTTGQVYLGEEAHINPIFMQYLAAKKRRRKDKPHKTRIQHLYINNMIRKTGHFFHDHNPFLPKHREIEITEKLELLNGFESNIAVITLPAEGEFLKSQFASDRKKKLSGSVIYDQILAIAAGNMQDSYQHDFFISRDIKELLYDETDEKNQLISLLDDSFHQLNLRKDQPLSGAERQAVFFHFIRFNLTRFIMNKLGPDSFNMTCKDAIDRGATSAAYYALMTSIYDKDKPISRDEFEEILQGPAVAVKGRPMNENILNIWNEIDKWIEAQDKLEIQGAYVRKPVPRWLRDWHRENALDSIYSFSVSHASETSIHHMVYSLKTYLDMLTKEDESCFFITKIVSDKLGIDKTWKMQAATKLRGYLQQNDFTKPLELCLEETKALQDGRLGKICSVFLNANGSFIPYYKQKEPITLTNERQALRML